MGTRRGPCGAGFFRHSLAAFAQQALVQKIGFDPGTSALVHGGAPRRVLAI
jgi:hypothetical protein